MAQREVEVKLLEVDREAMVAKLESLGARKVFDDDMEVRSFRPGKGISLLRVRKEGERAYLTIKTKPGDDGFASHRDEQSVEVSDFDTAAEMIGLLGYPPKWYVHKHRTSYVLDGVRFEFDRLLGEYADVPEYMEIEASSVDEIKSVLGRLGLREDEVVNWTGGDVIRHYHRPASL